LGGTFSESNVMIILDPDSFVTSRTSSGGTSPAARRDLTAAAAADLAEKKESLQLLVDHVTTGLELLLEDAHSITASLQ
jgi:argininosuccinate lyase